MPWTYYVVVVCILDEADSELNIVLVAVLVLFSYSQICRRIGYCTNICVFCLSRISCGRVSVGKVYTNKENLSDINTNTVTSADVSNVAELFLHNS